jgi:hypothetical protein
MPPWMYISMPEFIPYRAYTITAPSEIYGKLQISPYYIA